MRATPQFPYRPPFALFSFPRSLIPALFMIVLAAASFAVQAQDDPPVPPVDPNPNVPKEEPVIPVTMSASVSPTAIAAYTGTATLTWRATNANSCEYDDTLKSVSGSETVGPYTSSGTKSLVVTCTGEGEGNFLETTVSLTVNRAPPPVVTTTLSRTVLRANVDTFDVDFSAQYADYCTYAGTRYPTSGEVTLGPYPAGEHSLSFTCSGDGGSSPHTISWVSLNPVSFTEEASASPGSILANDADTVTVSWNAPDADDCTHGGSEYDEEDSKRFGPYPYAQAGSKSATITCENGLGAATSTATWEVAAPALPAAPRNLATAPNPSATGGFTLSWSAPSSGTTPTGYVVNLSGNPLSKTFSARTLSLSGLANGSYTYEVEACIGTANAPVCGGADTVTVVVNIPPGAPRNLRSSENPSTDGGFTLSWNAPSSGTTPTGYVVNLRGGSGNPLSKTFSARTLSISALSNGSYTYEVQACSGTASASNCGPAATVTVTVNRSDPPPSAPANLAATPNPSTTGSVVLSWDAPASGTTPTGYVVNLRGGSNNPLSKTFSTRTLSLSGLSSGAYVYEVKACTGTASAPNCGTAATVTVTVNRSNPPPAAPTSLTAAPNPSTTGSITLSWSAPSSGTTPTGYVVNLRGSLSNPLSKTFSARTLSLSGLSNGTYVYEVKACTGTASAPNCGTAVTVTVTVNRPNSPPAAPANLTATPNPSTTGSVVLNWDAPTSGTTPTGYVVNLRGGSSNPLSKTFSARTLSVSGLSNGSHTYEVKACSGTASAPNCGTAATVTVTVNRPNSPPAASAPTVTASLSLTAVKAHVNTVDLTWSSANTTWCRRDGESLPGTNGTETGLGPFHDGSHAFTVTCGSDSGTETATATVTVQASATVACSAYPAAPSDASGLVAGTYVYSVEGTTGGAIYGANPYTDDSHISKAVVHSGLVAAGKSAIVRLIREDGRFSFPGTTANGVFSERGGSWPRGYTLEKVSDCGGAAAAVPLAPGNLVSSASPSTDGSFTLSWNAPTGSGATPTGYLVYRSGTKSGYLSKTFADRTLSITGLDDGSYTYKVFACTGTVASPDCGPAANITVTVEIPDHDNDGIPDATDTDDDNDGMTDVWELDNQLNPRYAGDADQDADSDGHKNLAEFNAGSDPNSTLSYPGNIPVLTAGFDSRYTVQRGLINDDQLQDLLIQDPTTGIVPAVTKFVLIQQATGGFSLESTDGYTLPSATALTSVNSAIRLHDLNGDGVTDMLLHSLRTYIQDAADQVIYGNFSDDMYTIPKKHLGLGGEITKFFEDLSGWVNNADYFMNNLDTLATLPLINETTGIPQSFGDYELVGVVSIPEERLISDTTCLSVSPILCYEMVHDLLSQVFFTVTEQALVVSYATRLAVYSKVSIVTPTNFAVVNVSTFNREARMLAMNYLQPIRSSGTLGRGSNSAMVISKTLEGYFNTSVFANGLKSSSGGVFPTYGDYSGYDKIVREILNILDYIKSRLEPTGTQNPSSGGNGGTTNPGEGESNNQPWVDIHAITSSPLIISTTPAMPRAFLAAYVRNWSGSGEIRYSWYLELEHTTSNGQHTFEHRVPASPLFHSNRSEFFLDVWTPDWKTLLAGGSLTVHVLVNLPGVLDPLMASQKYTIWGQNPSFSEISGITGTGDRRNLNLAVAWQESRHRQFRADRYSGYGLPLVSNFSGDDGWGLMQIDNIPSFVKTEGHLWNWRTNLLKGIDYLDTVYSDALKYLQVHHVGDDPNDPNDDDDAWTWDPDDANTDDAVKIRIWNDALSRYNTGSPMYSPNGNDGNENCAASRGNNINEEAMLFDGCDYRNNVRAHISSSPWLIPSTTD